MGYTRFKKTKHYTLPELYKQIAQLDNFFPIDRKKVKRGKVELELTLQPTEFSISYKIKLIARLNSKSVKIFVVEPKINKIENDKQVPHLYPDGSLCLYYPKYNEWDYNDSWADTLIPWTSLWLFYYEIWKETGDWLGGGIHGKKYIPVE